MADKVLAIIRATALHENTLESVTFRPATGELLVVLLQPNDRSSYPDHELSLTFSGVASFAVDGMGPGRHEHGGGEDVHAIACVPAAGGYEATITLGTGSVPFCAIRLGFADLHYHRAPRWP